MAAKEKAVTMALVQRAIGSRRAILQTLAVVGTAGVTGYLFVRQYRMNQALAKALEGEELEQTGKKTRFDQALFFQRLRRLLPIVIPSWKSKEVLLLIFHTFVLLSRTFISIVVARLDGQIVKSIVDRDPWAFGGYLLKWLALSIPAVWTNSMIKFLENKLSIAFRTRMTTHLYSMYMTHETYYRVGNLDSRLANADQCLTEDVANFCFNLSHLYSQLSKPMFDVLLMGGQLWLLATNVTGRGSGVMPMVLGFGCVWATARLLRLMAPPFSRLVAKQAKLEGEVRFAHSRLIANAEEVAFYRGHKVERGILETCYRNLIRHMNLVFRRRIFYTVLEGFLMKYVWSGIGMVMIAMPVFIKARQEKASETPTLSTRTENYIVTRKLLLEAADAMERIMLAYKSLTELDGYMARCLLMLDVFEDVQKGKYKKQFIKASDAFSSPASSGEGEEGEKKKETSEELDEEEEIDMSSPKGEIVIGDEIKFDRVPIISPNGDILVKNLSFEVKRGMNLLITGPNGCGKSSLFRILGGLWPAFRGKVVKPRNSDMFYIPQRPYLSIGTLREQIIYPHSVAKMVKRKKKQYDDRSDEEILAECDEELEELLDWVRLKYIVKREGGWDAINDWKDVFSGGEKQRVAMARLFYHRPKYAILDECTSAVSIDVEGLMYHKAQELGITLMTVSHRSTLWKYHNYILQFDGVGGVQFNPLNATARLSLKEEKTKLEAELQGIPTMQKRLAELCRLLGENSAVLEESLKNSRLLPSSSAS